jgi:hypothetical protein
MFAVALAGLWPFVWHIGGSLLAIILSGGSAYFFPKARMFLMRVILAILIGMVLYITGAINEKSRCNLQVSELQQELDNAKAKSSVRSPLNIMPRSVRPGSKDKWDRDWRN